MIESLMKQLVHLESQLQEHKKIGELHDFIDGFHRELSWALNACMMELHKQRKGVA